MAAVQNDAYHLKYRPTSLDQVVGHSAVVTTLKGMVENKKYPSAIAFFGPPSAGKTTLSMCLASDTLGDGKINGPDYTYVNMSDNRSIDDVRQLIQTARLSPMGGVRRFIHLDEAQGILGSPASAAAVLQPLETPHPRMTWIISSMSPEKFTASTNGKAILSRCTQFHLKPFSAEDLTKQANRIIKGESLSFMTKELRDVVVRECQQEMRTLANLLEGLAHYHRGLPKADRPDKLTEEALQGVLSMTVSDDEKTAVRLLTSIYAKKISSAQKEILNIQDGFAIINKMMYANYALVNDAILKGQRHPKVWMTVAAKALKENLTKLDGVGLSDMVAMQVALIELKSQAQSFSIPEDQALFRFAATYSLKP